MLVLPIVKDHNVMSLRIKLKNAEKIRKRVNYEDAISGDIIINREKFSDSSFSSSKGVSASVDFIRSKSINHSRNFLITTQSAKDSKYYDVYSIPEPPKKVNDSLDKLYSMAITDMRKEIPKGFNKGRYVSFKELGIGENLTEDKIARLQQIVREEKDESRWDKLFYEAGVSDLEETVEFINNFEYSVLSDTVVPEKSIQDSIKGLSSIYTRDYKQLNNFYNKAKSNTELIMKLSYLNKLIYDKPLRISNGKALKQNQYVKVKDDRDYRNAA